MTCCDVCEAETRGAVARCTGTCRDCRRAGVVFVIRWMRDLQIKGMGAMAISAIVGLPPQQVRDWSRS